MNPSSLPVLYSFRRCPYAMRTRLALQASQQQTELREVVLRDKPQEMLQASPKATVPVLVEPDGTVIDESIDIMYWALNRNDPEHWLTPDQGNLEDMRVLIAEFDGPFKTRLDRYKYSSRHAENGNDAETIAHENRESAIPYLTNLNQRLTGRTCLFGNRFTLADAAIAPFVRQFANTDAEWFAKQDITQVQNWLNRFLSSDRFTAIMNKYSQWNNTRPGIVFPQNAP